MTRWFFISLTIFLAISLAPSFGGFGPFDNILELIKNAIVLGAGGLSFLEEFIIYSASEFPDSTPNNLEEYDFIVVGAGSAGATVAARLSEVEDVKVLLIEAGGHENLIMDIPLLAPFVQLDGLINWGYLTEKSDNYCRGIVNQQCKVAKGRVMGGTSTLNFMIAVRGNKHDYDEWSEITDDDNWSYESMLKSFKKLETFDAPLVDVDPEYHNGNGPLRIANPPYHSKLADAFVEAGVEMGFPPVDYNGRKQTGFSYIQATQINGERMSSNRAYLHPIQGRNNLVLSMYSMVTKVLIDPKTKTAYGVEFTKNGHKVEVIAKKEVILTAGAIASPQLLMLSGIGPAEHLKSFKIDVLQDLPVGENMMDHVVYGGLYFLVNQTEGITLPDMLNPENPALQDYLTKRNGPLSTVGGIEGVGFVNVDNLTSDNEIANVELLFGTVSLVSSALGHISFGINEQLFKQFFANQLYRHAWIIWPVLVKPRSRGRILLKSTNPKDHPRLLANYFSDPDDVRVLIKGIRMAIEVSKTQAMQEFGSKMHDQMVPGCEDHEPDSDAYWECALKTITMTFWHHSGTCKMGRENDTSAVVNTKLQVKGIKNLRVSDASIMPNIPTAHTNVPTIAIAEKFSDILKLDYGYHS